METAVADPRTHTLLTLASLVWYKLPSMPSGSGRRDIRTRSLGDQSGFHLAFQHARLVVWGADRRGDTGRLTVLEVDDRLCR